ncbi:MAG: DUF5320 domain-containing protein [Eubacteriales bacterium]|nr:DUF5320 domain-containing protein [Eubacteriales bacterium]
MPKEKTPEASKKEEEELIKAQARIKELETQLKGVEKQLEEEKIRMDFLEKLQALRKDEQQKKR